jgi:putative thioredoxin
MTPDLSYDVADADFETAVLQRSVEVPVLLDCWAPWCGPCRSLTPLLDKLVKAYGGRFELAKLNTDEAPRISAAMGIRSIPQVTLFIGGRPVGQFMGALPEGQIREFLDKHLPPDVIDAEPDPLDAAEALLSEGALDDAKALLDGLADLPDADRRQRQQRLLARWTLATTPPAGDPVALAARIAAQPRDFEARFELAALLVHADDYAAAFEQLLEVVLRDRAELRERARRQLVEWFDVCPDAAAVSRGRRYLGMYLN